MPFDQQICCPLYGGITFDGLAIDGQERVYLVIRTAN
jgi:hypothetical protein